MKSVWLQRGRRPRALVFFAGWGMDDRPFRRLVSSDYDVCVCYDYRNLPASFGSYALRNSARDASPVSESIEAVGAYDEVTIVAWSFGCGVAAQVIAHGNWPVQVALALNGTVTPEDDEVGIPKRWLDATAESLLQGGWSRFVRRMCWDKAARQDFEGHAPQRDLAGAVAELDVLRQLTTPARCDFTRALIGTQDRIILPENQQRCWERFHVPVQRITAPHYPFHLWQSWEELLLAGTEEMTWNTP